MSIVIVNTSCANLFSLQVAIKRLGYNALISDHIQDIVNAEKVFFPGVGSAKSVMRVLKNKNLINIIRKLTQPVLGICLGMQLFSRTSAESNHCKMLKIIPDITIKLNSKEYSLPHIGWNQVYYTKNNILFKKINPGTRFYFLHSYCIYISQYTIAFTEHGSCFSSAIQKNNFFGVQFHPEKSGTNGLQLLKNFLEI
ncbi:imidazole glycerol-phosphate synthase [Buchnera aphidicola (Cinara tujafilina)]|uniref:Imidazole glycerol phosphate synthase subunit HisH n=1 Tax=Buchnera aphidicola (Cinara tujafilina) TaxID=261317 RepID=F7WZ10_9GAMM|nr:imidazole glycerol phosphate synthase subunit HisH [Buchnera aphidicola]AEH39660.1 imidazole glycerol-phosphate synthase [Buchnera aphidicola (Cinara tujafilina)]